MEKQKGVSLIEVCVSLFIFSMGLLAIALFQIKLLSFDQSAFFHSLALTRLQSIQERLAADPHHVAFQLNRWNILNQQLLPQGHGSVILKPQFHGRIQWYQQTKLTIEKTL